MKIKVIISLKNMARISKFEHVAENAVDAFHAVEAVVMSPLCNDGSEKRKRVYLEDMMKAISEMKYGNHLAFESWIIRLERMEEGAQE